MIAEMDALTKQQCEFVPQAVLKASPAFFKARGLAFRAGVDDLNAYEVAELTLDDLPFALMRHEGTPEDETELCLPDTIPLAALPPVIARILQELGLPAAAIKWRRQSADTPF